MVLFVWDSRRGAECRNIQELQQTAAGSQTCIYVLVIENTATPVNILLLYRLTAAQVVSSSSIATNIRTKRFVFGSSSVNVYTRSTGKPWLNNQATLAQRIACCSYGRVGAR